MTKIVEPTNNPELEALLSEEAIKIPQIGDTVHGVVLSASKAEVRLDIDGVMMGVVRGRELYYEDPDYAGLKPGSEVDATVVDSENENGDLELSFKQAGQEKAWVNLEEAYKNKTNIKIRINEANRGGLLISYIQVPGFLPVSQLSPENYPRVSGGDKTKILEKLKSLVGMEVEVKVITFDRKEQKLVVSEKDAWQEGQKDVMSQFKINDTVDGTITAITNFGVFINFAGNLEGLIHISELAWQRIDDLSDMYHVGDNIKAEIISIDGSKIFLSAKKLITDPWKEVASKYTIGQVVKGTILKINPFGLFVELDKDIHGLAHISQVGLANGQKLDTLYNSGDVKDFTIVSIEPNEHRLGLAIGEIKKKPAKTKEEEVKAEEAAKTEEVKAE